MNCRDLTNAVADLTVELEYIRDNAEAIRTARDSWPPACADALHRLANILNPERMADFLESANAALTECENAEGM